LGLVSQSIYVGCHTHCLTNMMTVQTIFSQTHNDGINKVIVRNTTVNAPFWSQLDGKHKNASKYTAHHLYETVLC